MFEGDRELTWLSYHSFAKYPDVTSRFLAFLRIARSSRDFRGLGDSEVGYPTTPVGDSSVGTSSFVTGDSKVGTTSIAEGDSEVGTPSVLATPFSNVGLMGIFDCLL